MADSIYPWLVLPATWLHSAFSALAPPLASIFDNALDHGDWRIPLVLSLLIWALVAFALGRGLRAIGRALRPKLRAAEGRLFRFRLSSQMRIGRWRERWAEWFPPTDVDNEAPEIRLDPEALQIMQFAAALPQGRSLAVTDLATLLDETPRAAEARLEVLARLLLVERTGSNTDGFRDYRLTRPGTMYAELLGRQAAT
ncbi:MAG: hypothetical protein AAFM91_14465 [Pseudomonadota bacterium]